MLDILCLILFAVNSEQVQWLMVVSVPLPFANKTSRSGAANDVCSERGTGDEGR